MTRILLALGLIAGSLFASSCCCTSDAKAPKLGKLPPFRELPPAESHYVEPAK